MALVEIEEEEVKFDGESTNEELKALFTAVANADQELLLKIIVELGPDADLNKLEKNGETLIHAASDVGNIPILESLVQRGLDVHQLNDNCENAIHAAVRRGFLDVVRFFTEKGVSLDIQNKNGQAPIHLAARSGNMEVMEFLCTAGANINAQDKSGECGLHYACWHGLHRIVMVLCAAKGRTDIQNKEGESPLICASARGSLDCVKILLNSGAKVHLEDRNGWTALEHAIKRHQTTIALMLINAGAKVNHVDHSRDTTLHIACREGLLPVVQALCAYGCRVDVYNGGGLTPLHIASRSGVLEIVRCLLLAGSNPQLPSKEGVYPEIMALAQGHTNAASLLSRMKPEKRAICVEQLVPTSRPLPRIKLKVFGSPMSGKTTLIESLKSNYISGFFRKKFKSMEANGDYLSMRQRTLPSEMNFEVQHETYTKGINSQNFNISGAGEFSAWEFSGYEPYYLIYDHFIGDTSCIHAVLFCLNDPYDLIRTRVLFWLHFIRARIPAREPLGFCGKPRSMAKVVLIGTYVDKAAGVRNQKGLIDNKDAFNILQEVKKEFRYTLEICEEVFCVNCCDPLSPDIKQLKIRIGEWRTDILKRLPNANGFLDVVTSKVSEWTNGSTFPVVTWQQFVDQVRSKVNPLCSEDHLKDLIQELQYTGEVVYIESETEHDMIVLNPRWLCNDILGFLLSFDNISQARVTGSFTMDDIQFMIANSDTAELLRILIALDVVTSCKVEDEIQYEFPCLNFVESYHGLWEKEKQHENFLYAGMQFRSARGQLVHMFPRIQNQLRRSLINDKEDDENEVSPETELDQWFHGSKLTCSEVVECLLTMEESDQLIEVKARGPPDSINMLFGFYQDIINLIEQVIDDMCPSLEYEIYALRPEDLKTHNGNYSKVHQREVFRRMLDYKKGLGETKTGVDWQLDDLLFFSSREIMEKVRLGPDLHISCLRTATFQKLCLHLDPPDHMGRDWCLLAVKLGMMQSVPKFDNTNEWLRSRTAKILDEWGREQDSTTGKLIDILLDINRPETAELLIESTPLYNFAPAAVGNIANPEPIKELLSLSGPADIDQKGTNNLEKKSTRESHHITPPLMLEEDRNAIVNGVS